MKSTDTHAIHRDEQGLLTIRLTCGKRHNALSKPILQELQDILEQCASSHAPEESSDPVQNGDVRAILLEATGPTFSSGHDFRDFQGASQHEQREVLQICGNVNKLLTRVPQVSVAAVTGNCLAGGAQLAASCDLLLAERESARFCFPGVRLGGFCHTPAVPLVQRVGARKALEMTVLAREIDADEAFRIGLANLVVPRAEWRVTVDEMMAQLVAGFNKSVADGKRTLYAQAAARSLDEKYEIATEAMVDSKSTQNVSSAL